MDSIIGKTILGYKIIKRIGTGGFGDVYQVERNNIVGNTVRALKVIELPKESQYIEILNAIGGSRERADKYFERELNRVIEEIRVFSMLSPKDSHHIVIYYENDVIEVSKHRYRIYILMEMLTPLDQWLQENNLSYKQGIEISLSIAKAIKLCHDNNIMHRDIKLNNVFVGEEGQFKLGDFGVSKRLDSISRAHTIKGTPTYIAPEVYMGKEEYNKSVDIYSLGILTYYIFNKRRYPFFPDFPNDFSSNDIENAFYKRINYEKLKNPICGDDKISQIILKALDKPKFRYDNIDDYIKDLEEVYESADDSKFILECKDYTDDGIYEEKEPNLTNVHKNDSISFQEYSLRTKGFELFNRKRKYFTGCFAILLIVIAIASGSIWSNINYNKERDISETKVLLRTQETTEQIATQQSTTKSRKTKKKKTNKNKETEQIVTTRAEVQKQQNNSNSTKDNDYNFKFENIY